MGIKIYTLDILKCHEHDANNGQKNLPLLPVYISNEFGVLPIDAAAVKISNDMDAN